MFGCVTLKTEHPDVTVADLREPPRPRRLLGQGNAALAPDATLIRQIIVSHRGTCEGWK